MPQETLLIVLHHKLRLPGNTYIDVGKIFLKLILSGQFYGEEQVLRSNYFCILCPKSLPSKLWKGYIFCVGLLTMFRLNLTLAGCVTACLKQFFLIGYNYRLFWEQKQIFSSNISFADINVKPWDSFLRV